LEAKIRTYWPAAVARKTDVQVLLTSIAVSNSSSPQEGLLVKITDTSVLQREGAESALNWSSLAMISVYRLYREALKRARIKTTQSAEDQARSRVLYHDSNGFNGT
jgi:hypothetical protein